LNIFNAEKSISGHVKKSIFYNFVVFQRNQTLHSSNLYKVSLNKTVNF